MPNVQTIRTFTGEYRFLSNFYAEPDGTHVEGEYQAAKCADPADIQMFLGKSPATCKAIGRKVKLIEHWDDIKVDIMLQLVREKFADHRELAIALLDTGDSKLIEGNTWGDQFWGRVDAGWGTGENWLGRILMQVREELRS